MECGTIATGRCAGDFIWAYGIGRARDPIGCDNYGNRGQEFYRYQYQISGKCNSKCAQGDSDITYSSPTLVNNWGLVSRK